MSATRWTSSGLAMSAAIGKDAFEGLEAIGAAGDGGDPRALVREPLGGRGSDAAAGSGDDGDAAFK